MMLVLYFCCSAITGSVAVFWRDVSSLLKIRYRRYLDVIGLATVMIFIFVPKGGERGDNKRADIYLVLLRLYVCK